jgi:hypothetical protein
MNGEGCTCRMGRRCEAPAKHPRISNWQNVASTDPDVISTWATEWPNMGLGLVTGAVAGFVVLDIDPQHGGDDSLAALIDELGPLPDTVTQLTGGGGRHILLAHPGGTLATKANVFGVEYPGVDIRADRNGQIVAHPAVHRSGRRYEWDLGQYPGEVPIAPMPERWASRVTHAAKPPTTEQVPEVIPEGKRNHVLASLGGSLRRRGASEATILAALRTENNLRCSPPLTDREITAIARSLARYEPGDPADKETVVAFKQTHLSSIMARGVVPPDSIIGDGVIRRGQKAMLVGGPGVGKTFVLLQLARAVATGQTWMGMGTVAARVGMVLLESPEWELYQRGQVVTGDGDTTWWGDVDVITEEDAGGHLDLLNPGAFEAIMEWATVGEYGLMVLDPFAHLHTTDERDAEHIMQVVHAVDRLRLETGAAVLLAHHLRKSQSGRSESVFDATRGPTQITASFNTILRLVARSDNYATLEFGKVRSARPPETVWLRRQDTGLLVPTDQPATKTQVMEDRRLWVVEYLTEKGERTKGQIHEALKAAGHDISASTAKTDIAALVKDGQLYVRGQTTTAVYGVNNLDNGLFAGQAAVQVATKLEGLNG